VERARDALVKPGEHLVLWGFSGVGKTSLFQHLAKDLRLTYTTIYPKPPTSKRSAAIALLEDALADLGYEQALTVRTTNDETAHLDLGPPQLKAGIGASESQEVIAAIQANTLDRALVKALAASNIRVLFIDGFEFVPDDERAATAATLGALMHELSDRAAIDSQMTKLVVSGVAEAADQLVPTEGPVARRVYQLRVPRMTDDELIEILERGSRLLRLGFADNASKAIVRASDGFPYYTHVFAYHAVERARKRLSGNRVEHVTYPDWELSLDAALQGAELRLTKPYIGAIEPSNAPQLRKKILEALAELPRFSGTLAEIRESYLDLFRDDREAHRSGYFQQPLRELSEDFAMLRVLPPEAPNQGSPYGFRDPLMRSFVRLHRLHPHLIELSRANLLAS
jgi:hypothetical protein